MSLSRLIPEVLDCLFRNINWGRGHGGEVCFSNTKAAHERQTRAIYKHHYENDQNLFHYLKKDSSKIMIIIL